MTQLTYQQRVLLAALELTEESPQRIGFEFHYAGEDLLVTPWFGMGYFGGRRVSTDFYRVDEANRDIYGRDEDIIRNLKEKVGELERRLGLDPLIRLEGNLRLIRVALPFPG